MSDTTEQPVSPTTTTATTAAPASTEAPATETASEVKKEEQVSPVKSTFGKVNPDDLDVPIHEDTPKAEEAATTETKKTEEAKPNADETKTEKKEVDENGNPIEESNEALTEEQKAEKLFGKKEEKPKAEEHFATAVEKKADSLEEAIATDDRTTLEALNTEFGKKPRMAKEVSQKMFSALVDPISNGDGDSLQYLANLHKTAPLIADGIAKQFWTGEGEDKQFMKGAEDLLAKFNFEPDPIDEKGLSDDEKAAIVTDLDAKAEKLATDHFKTTKEEFIKTPEYKTLFDKAKRYVDAGMKVEDFWEDLEKSILHEKTVAEAEARGAESQSRVNAAADAGVQTPATTGDEPQPVTFSPEDEAMLNVFGVDKTKVAQNIANERGN